MKKIKIKRIKAFTLVELIIVITILAVLATIAFVSFQGYIKGSRDSVRLSTISNISKGLESFQVTSGTLPKPENQIGTGTINGQAVTYVGTIGDTISNVVKINKTPKDPLTGGNYIYGIDSGNTKYQVAGVVENLSTSLPFFSQSYADAGLKAKVNGNYKGLLKFNGKIYNIPSLIITFSGSSSQDLLTGSTNYIIDKGDNIPYLAGSAKILNSMTPTQVLQKLTNTGASLSVTGITIPSDISNFNSSANLLSQNLGYDTNTLGNFIFGDSFATIASSQSQAIPIITVTSNKTNVNIFNECIATYGTGTCSSFTSLKYVVNSGIYVYSANVDTPSLTTGTGWLANAVIIIENNGNIVGGGGPNWTDRTTNRAYNGGPALMTYTETNITNNGNIIGGAGSGGPGEGDSCGGCGGGNGGTWGGAGGAGITFNNKGTITNNGAIYGGGGGGAGGGGGLNAGVGSGYGGRGAGSMGSVIYPTFQAKNCSGYNCGGDGGDYGIAGNNGDAGYNGMGNGGAGGYAIVLNGKAVTYNGATVVANSSYTIGTWLGGTKGRIGN